MKLVVKFSSEEAEVLAEFQQAINSHGTILSLEDICKQAVFYAINDSRRRAQEMAASVAQDIASKSGVTDGNTVSGNTEGDTNTALVSEVTNTNLDAESASSGDQVTSTT